MADNASLSSTISSASIISFEFNAQDIHSSCPEKIIFCIDLAQDVEKTTVKSKEKGDVSLLAVWKNALELFVWNKSAMNSNHEFALVVLTDKANWYCDFNKNPELVCDAIKSIEAMDESYDSFDTASLYSIIYENCPPPPSSANSNPLLPPPFVVRAVLLYCRTHSLPVFRGEVMAHDELMSSPNFFLDVLYSHELPGVSNLCQSIFDILAEMCPKPKAMVLDWSSNVVKLFNCFAKLIAHPLQRPLQSHMDSKLL